MKYNKRIENLKFKKKLNTHFFMIIRKYNLLKIKRKK